MLRDHDIVNDAMLQEIETEADRIIEDAITFAMESPDPSINEATKYVYTDGAVA